MMKTNPFYFIGYPVGSPFCNRKKELKDLGDYASGRASVVLYSPRRHGKTTLAIKLGESLSKEAHAIVAYADFFGVSSIDEVASRLAKAVYKALGNEEKALKKIKRIISTFRPVVKPDESGQISLSVEPTGQKQGIDLLEDTLNDLSQYVHSSDRLVHLALDEFQEITTLKDSKAIEGKMRLYMQNFRASVLFMGSRRTLLKNMFSEEKRPFFQSSIMYQLGSIPRDEFALFIQEQFDLTGKECDLDLAYRIVDLAGGISYYTQKTAFFVFTVSNRIISNNDVTEGYRRMVESELPNFESRIGSLATQQIALLKAIAKEPTNSLMSLDWMGRHKLGSIGGVTGARDKLKDLDYIEEKLHGVWMVVDPVFAEWLLEM